MVGGRYNMPEAKRMSTQIAQDEATKKTMIDIVDTCGTKCKLQVHSRSLVINFNEFIIISDLLRKISVSTGNFHTTGIVKYILIQNYWFQRLSYTLPLKFNYTLPFCI